MILTLSGRPGAGKSTLERRLWSEAGEITSLPSTTTRAKKISDADRGEYRWVSEVEFERMAKAGEFLWQVGEFGNRYATRKDDVALALQGKRLFIANVVLSAVIDLREEALRQGVPKAVESVYLTIDNEHEMRRRLLARGDSKEEAERRIKESRTWDVEARKSELWFEYIDGEKQSEQEVYLATLLFLKELGWPV